MKYCIDCKKPIDRRSTSQFPELRFAIDNGRTLCVPCHKTTENYGKKSLLYKKLN